MNKLQMNINRDTKILSYFGTLHNLPHVGFFPQKTNSYFSTNSSDPIHNIQCYCLLPLFFTAHSI